MTDIAIVGDDEFSLGFVLAGITKTYDVSAGLDDAFMMAILNPDNGILITDHKFYSQLTPKIRARCDASNRPVVVVLGHGKGDALREQIKRTVGVDLWKN